MGCYSSIPSLEEELGEFRCLTHRSSVYHDVFLSYRVVTEKKVADKLALLLDGFNKTNGSKVRTFLDSNCLLDGSNWEKNFLSALHHSTLIVLIISEAGLDLSSASNSEFTKIQRADHEQDNCLLEYEYALDLHEAKRADLFILCVSKETELGGIKCKVRFPTSREAMAKRRAMYSDTREHQHRDDTKGPLVGETMGKLLGLLTPPNKGQVANFAHLDPDDVASRIPDILWRLEHSESQIPAKRAFIMGWKDIAHLKMKVLGGFCGMILPFLSLLLILSVRSARHQALRLGMIVGHGIDFFAAAVYLFYGAAFSAVPKLCGTYSSCQTNAPAIAAKYPAFATFCSTSYNTTCLFTPEESRTCMDCLCDNWTLGCSQNQNDQKVQVFMAILVLIVCLGLFFYAKYLHDMTINRKNRERV